MRLGLVHFAAHTIAAATHVSSAQPQRPQVFLHLFICASLLQKLGSGAFISHHREPKPGIVLSSHDGGGEGRFEHLNMDSHEFVHFFLSFLQDFLHFFLSAHPLLHTTWSLAHSSLHSCSFSHGSSGDGGGEGGGGGGGLGKGGGGLGKGGNRSISFLSMAQISVYRLKKAESPVAQWSCAQFSAIPRPQLALQLARTVSGSRPAAAHA